MNSDQAKSPAKEQEIVLFAVLGLTPAVLTETLWALAAEGPDSVPDRIILCTTSKGHRTLGQSLFSHNQWESFKEAMAREIGLDLTGKLRFGPTGDSIRIIPTHQKDRELQDILTTEDNQAVGDFFLEHLRSFTESPNTQIIASIAGGRKSMGALLLTVMSLIGRETDRVCHVLVEDPWDRVEGVLYPQSGRIFPHPDGQDPLDAADLKIHLADIPFVPLRQIFPLEVGRFSGNYRSLLNQLRARSSTLTEQLHLSMDPARGLCRLTNQPIDLSPREFLFFLYFAVRASEGRGPLTTFAQFPVEEAHSLAHTLAQSAELGHWSHDALLWIKTMDPQEDLRKIAMAIRRKAAQSGIEPVVISRLVPGKGYLGIELSPNQITIKS